MMKREKDILRAFSENDYEPDFSKISNKIKVKTTIKHKIRINIKVLATSFASLLTLAIIVPFSIDYFNDKPTSEPSQNEVFIPSDTVAEVESTLENTTETITDEKVPGDEENSNATYNPLLTFTYNNIEYELLPITYPESEQEIIFDIDNAIETDIYYIDLNNLIALEKTTNQYYKLEIAK